VSRNDVILGVFALALILFSLTVALVVPRRSPGFPGRNLRLFALVAGLLVASMLTAVEVLGETHHFEAEGGAAETQTGATGTAPTETGGGGGAAKGDPAAGKKLFAAEAEPPCASCHTLTEAGATATVGPNLDQVLKGKDAAFIRESILDPNAEIAPGFAASIMPQDYGQKLSDKQIADLVAFLVQATGR
jgi:mono/diheme cytochrome c family protein